MTIRLTSFVEGKKVALELQEGTYTLGGRGADIEVVDPAIVGPYAEISLGDGRLRIRDLGSEAGVYVNGYRVFGAIPRELVNGDTLQIGESSIEVESDTAEVSNPVRLVLTRAGRELALEVGAGTYVVGRSDEADIVVPDPAVAKKQLELTVGNQVVELRPLEGAGEMRKNREPISAGATSLGPGDRLELSRESILSVEIPGATISRAESGTEQAEAADLSARGEARAGGGLDVAWWLFSFEGRIGRSRWWMGHVVGFLFLMLPLAPAIFFAIRGSKSFVMFSVLMMLLSIPVTWSSFALSAKRFHDLGMTGWMTAIGLIPFLGGLILIVMCGFLPGNPGPNTYGSRTDSRA